MTSAEGRSLGVGHVPVLRRHDVSVVIIAARMKDGNSNLPEILD